MNTDRSEIEILCELFDFYREGFPIEKICRRISKNMIGNVAVGLSGYFVSCCRPEEPLVARWTPPMTRKQLLCLYDPSFRKAPETTMNNYRGHLNSLSAMNIVYQCGLRELMVFRVEPVVLSWACFSTKPVICPGSVCTMLRSRDEIFNSIKHEAAKRRMRVTTDKIFGKIAEFFSGLAKRVDPSLMAPCWDGECDPEHYFAQLYRTLVHAKPLHGLQASAVDMDAISPEVYRIVTSPVNSPQFDEILPEHEDVVPDQDPGGNTRNPSANRRYRNEMDALDKVPTGSLDVVGGGFLCLLQAFQRLVLPQTGVVAQRYRLYQDYGHEKMYADNIRNALLNAGKHNKETILSWINWYANYKAEPGVQNAQCALKLLFETWEEFKAMSESVSWANVSSFSDFPENESIYENMNALYGRTNPHCWFEECATRYGFVATFAFLVTKMDADIAEAELRTYFDEVKNNMKEDCGMRSRFLDGLHQTMVRDAPAIYNTVVTNRLKEFIKTYESYVSPVFEKAKTAPKVLLDDPQNAAFWSAVRGKINLRNPQVVTNENNCRAQG